jgi:predicted nucleic acid-binding Zn ribbon protein
MMAGIRPGLDCVAQGQNLIADRRISIPQSAGAMKTRRRPPETCPVCGADVPRTARACPQCGADEQSGWNDEATVYDGLDLPDEEFSYEEFAEREFGQKRRRTARERLGWIVVAIVALLLVLALILGWF